LELLYELFISLSRSLELFFRSDLEKHQEKLTAIIAHNDIWASGALAHDICGGVM